VSSKQWAVDSWQRAMGTNGMAAFWDLVHPVLVSFCEILISRSLTFFTKLKFCEVRNLKFRETDQSLLPTVYYAWPTVLCPLPMCTVLCLLPAAHYPRPTVHCPLTTAYQLHSQNLHPLSANLNYFPQAVALLKSK
jgi:hypothetical protein